MADVETTKVEEETTTVKEVTKEVPASEAVATPEEKVDAPSDENNGVLPTEGENGSAPEEAVNGGANGNTNGVASSEPDHNGKAETESTEDPEPRKRKSEGVEVADATDGVSAEKKAKLEEKSEAVADEPANGRPTEAEVTA